MGSKIHIRSFFRNLRRASETGDSPWQVSLRGLFGMMTGLAVTAAVVAARGLGSSPLPLGIWLAWLNARGRLERLQTTGTRPKLYYAGWALLIASLFLPAAEGCSRSPIAGWQAAVFAVQLEAAALEKAMQAPRESIMSADFLARHLLFLLINLANLSLLCSPLLLWRLQLGKGRAALWAMNLGAVGVWSCGWNGGQGLLIGYYLWCAAVATLLAGSRIGWRTFTAMLLLAATLLGLLALSE